METQDEILVPRYLVKDPDYGQIFKSVGENVDLLDLERGINYLQQKS